ncbi:DUF58 domain-containing protein [Novosphingobium sp. YJ-S2-02]|uniref:DUF58 domain-containing protein n=1 Tax=Novosphingobium aureum TaxID=2792964 RepID=A0A931MK51_9SPHN|nr:DUF58 domain-containing protein [Novosphingobium aureum]MBH0111641.1 DUF58 domain-containing protein [Novosphingobium aureum]
MPPGPDPQGQATGLSAPIVPTARAVVLLVVAAPLALVVAASAPALWIVAPFLGLVLLALIVADGLLAGRLLALDLKAPDDIEVGEAGRLGLVVRFARGRRSRVEAALACDPRLVEEGRCLFVLDHDEETGEGQWLGAGRITPNRRGTAQVGGAWLRWRGPLGLGARQFAGPLAHEIRIWPNLAQVRSPTLQTFLRDSQVGLVARRLRGEGTQFEALAEYQSGMDRRRIDWKASARHAHLYAKEYETERNNQVVFALDCSQPMCEPVAGMPRLDRAVSAALATAYVALRGGDRVSLYGFAARPEVRTPFVAASGAFHRLQRAAAGLDYRPEQANYTLALATLAGTLQRRSLIVIFADFTDLTGAELMVESIARLASKHVVIVVTMVDEELDDLSAAEPGDIAVLSQAVAADLLLRQRTLVTERLRRLGVDVIEAPHEAIGTRLIDAYLQVKRKGAIG